MKKTILILFILISGIWTTSQAQINSRYIQDTVFLKIGVPIACDIIGMSENSISINFLNEKGEIGFSEIPNNQIKKAHKRSIIINIHDAEEYNDKPNGEQVSKYSNEAIITQEKVQTTNVLRERMFHIGLITSFEYGSSIWRFGGSFSYVGKPGIGLYTDMKYRSEKVYYYYDDTYKIKYTTLNGGMAFRLGDIIRMYTAGGVTRVTNTYNDEKDYYTTAALGFLFGNRRSVIGGQLGFESIFLGGPIWSSIVVGITVNF